MRASNGYTKWFLATLMAAMMAFSAGCGHRDDGDEDSPPPPDTTPPTVLSVFPVANASDVAINTKVMARFSESMNAATISTATFTVTGPGATTVAGTVSYGAENKMADFVPTAALPQSTLFTASLSTGVKDASGNALAATHSWTFTTGAGTDVTAPTVTFTTPGSGGTNANFNMNITAVFSEPMDVFTLTTATFTLKQGVTPIPGIVTSPGSTASFNPDINLTPATTYTATVTTGAKDLAGNALAASYSWSFTTGVAPDTTAPTVAFTMPGSAAIDVAFNMNITAVFSEPMDSLSLTTATFTLNQGSTPIPGTVVCPGTTATFNPNSNLTPSTEYTATITTGAEDAAGNAIAANYSWTFTTGIAPDTLPPTVTFTIAADGAVNVPFNTNITAVFSEPMDPVTLTTASFTLSQGATPVAGAVVSTGSTATLDPTADLVPSTVYTATITTTATDSAGNPLALQYSWTFTTGIAPDITPPTVTFTIPDTAATNVPFNMSITAVFSEPMDPLTLTMATFTLTQGATPVTGPVACPGATATLNPSTDLIPSTLYTATITTGAQDLSGNALAINHSWTFTTGAAPDTTLPTVTFTIPADMATGVALNTNATAVFSETMDPLTLTTASFTLMQGATPVAGPVVCPGSTATLNPTADLAPSTLYTATITTVAKDLAGNALAVNYSWTFTTGIAPDAAPPTVLLTIPANNATNISLSGNISAIFNEPMDPLSLTTTTFTLMQGATPVPGPVTCPGSTATLDPTGNLAANTIYTATITIGAMDLAGNALATAYVWTFTTTSDITAPSVTSTIPVAGTVAVSINTGLAAYFGEPMDSMSITTTSFLLTGPGTTVVTGTVSYSATNRVASFLPSGPLASNTLFTATITTAAKDAIGNALAANFDWTFTTSTLVDSLAPTVTSTIPLNTATNVHLNAKVTAVFSEAMKSATLSTTSFSLMAGASPVAGSVTCPSPASSATFTPASNLAPNTMFTATVTTLAADMAGNLLAANFVWTFTTGTEVMTAQLPVNLQSAGAFAVLAGSTVSNTGPTIINGDVGLSPSSAIVGFPPGVVNGTIYGPGPIADQAKLDLTVAYQDAAGRSVDSISCPGNLGGLTLAPGLYTNSSSVLISGTGPLAILTLDAQGDENAVWIFRIGSTLTTDPGTSIVLSGGAKADNIYWQVSTSATLGTTCKFKGNILAAASITLETGATLDGRAVTQTSAVSTDSNIITKPVG